MNKHLIIFCSLFGLLLSCNNENKEKCSTDELLEVFTNSDGREIFIYQNGELYSETDGSCVFELQYFNPTFQDDIYQVENNQTFIITDGFLFPTKSNYIENFESTSSFTELFLQALDDFESYWTNFTLQSPSTPTVAEYIELSHCILNENCDFIDNKIELINDPLNDNNTVLKFTSVPPTPSMEITKSSITSTLNFYQKTSEVWFEASYYIESGLPFSIVDFENTHFSQSPGPRIIISNNKLELENKFGSKIKYENNTETMVPLKEWFTVKVHLEYDNENEGIIEVWQNGNLLIFETGINLPTSNSIQDKLEIGVTASTEGCELLMDNIRISETPF